VTEHLYNTPGGVDVARWPLVIIRPPSGVSVDGSDLDAFCRELESMLARKRPFAALYDVRGIRMGADRRNQLIAWATQNDAAIRQYMSALAFVIGSELERAEVTSAFWRLNRTYHACVFESESDAERWLLSEFARGEGAN
jgi:hypothetical protein